ncbi:AAA family ATPase [Mycobacterium aquaticum]|uniref:AAA family ATPase n=1 Tax=Mycobacterium aquaticum TaxID=1927124 RepID=A0A1W9ZUB9_9MYCO|nr:AAA family ATPase [Mycobacterium aquaticum]ORA21351.1 hypothetical protein BST13_37775 [Mycobacterium aquaticum]
MNDSAPPAGDDFIEAVLYQDRINKAVADGAPLRDLTGMELHDALTRWEADHRKPTPKRRNGSKYGKDRKRHIALKILDRVERQLSSTATCRDDASNTAIYDLGKFVNEGCLSRDEVADSIIRAAYSNGLDKDRRNGGIRKIRNNVPRVLDDAQRNGETVDWTRFDWLATETEDSAESGATPTELDTPVYASELLTRSDLRNLPDPQPLIDNVLDQGTTALLYGKWGTAKTFIALDFAASVATGRAWQGRPTVQRRVLYVVGEGAYGFKARVQAWEVGWQNMIGDEWLAIMPHPVNLTRSVDVANLIHLIEWGGYGFVILDTLARCMVGADENSAKDCGIVVDALTRLLASTPGGRGVVLGVHHAGKDGKTLRGSSAFESGADTVYFAERDGQLISLTREKRKDGPENDSHLLVFDPMPGTGSGVMSSGQSVISGDPGETRVATLRLIMSQHFRLSGATPTQLRQLAVDEGPMTRATFYRAISDLLESGWLVNTGTDKRPFYWIASERD